MAAKNEAKIKFTAETGDFNAALKSANNELSALRSEAKLNAAQMKATGTTVEGLQNKHQNLQAQLAATQTKTQALNDKLQVAVECFGENSDEATKLRNQLNASRTAEINLQSAIDAVNRELAEQEAAQNETKSATEELTDKISEQKTDLDKLKSEYVEAVLKFGAASDEAAELAGKIDTLSGELAENKTKMSDAERAADELDRSISSAGDSASSASDGGFTVFKGALADLASNAIQAVIGKISELISYFAELPAATMELRQDMGTLTTAFDEVGFSSDTAKNTWKELYAVFGEDDRAVEAANNISRMAQNEKDLNDWVTITTGIWATYQDALPVEGLAEAAGETAKVGTVTGGLADALNWSSEAAVMFADYMSEDVTTAEDAFNVALSECSNEAERQALITDTLTKLYGGAADTYRDTTSAQMEAKEATADQILAENNLATAIEPVTTKFTELKTQLLTALLPVIESVSNTMLSMMTWMQEHPVLMQVIIAVIGVLAAAIAAIVIVVGVWTVAQWALNSAILANPITWIIVGIIAAIAAVVAIVVLLINYWDEVVAAVQTAVDAVVGFLAGLWEGIKAGFQAVIDWIAENWQSILLFLINPLAGVASYLYEHCEWFRNIIDSIVEWFKNLWSTVATWVNDKIITPIVNFFTNMWNKVVEIVTNMKTGVVNKWNDLKSSITNTINAVKSTVTTVWNAIKNAVTTPIQSAYTTVSTVFGNIKTAISDKINAAKEAVSSAIEKIKGFFNFSWSLPSLKLPHFTVTGKFSLNPISVPKFSISWYKEGGILNSPTLFGFMGGKLLGGGEAGPEAVAPIDKLQGYVSAAVDRTMQRTGLESLVNAIEDLANRDIVLNVNGRQFAVATAGDVDNVNGNRLALQKRGLAL